MFLHLSVILLTGGLVSASVHAGMPPQADTPLEQTPHGETPLWSRQQTPPGLSTPPWLSTPPTRTKYNPLNFFWNFFLLFIIYFFSYPPYSQRAAGTHPTGMHSCFTSICLSMRGVVYTPLGRHPTPHPSPVEKATAADGTHPTGMHSFNYLIHCSFIWLTLDTGTIFCGLQFDPFWICMARTINKFGYHLDISHLHVSVFGKYTVLSLQISKAFHSVIQWRVIDCFAIK